MTTVPSWKIKSRKKTDEGGSTASRSCSLNNSDKSGGLPCEKVGDARFNP